MNLNFPSASATTVRRVLSKFAESGVTSFRTHLRPAPHHQSRPVDVAGSRVTFRPDALTTPPFRWRRNACPTIAAFPGTRYGSYSFSVSGVTAAHCGGGGVGIAHPARIAAASSETKVFILSPDLGIDACQFANRFYSGMHIGNLTNTLRKGAQLRRLQLAEMSATGSCPH